MNPPRAKFLIVCELPSRPSASQHGSRGPSNSSIVDSPGGFGLCLAFRSSQLGKVPSLTGFQNLSPKKPSGSFQALTVEGKNIKAKIKIVMYLRQSRRLDL